MSDDNDPLAAWRSGSAKTASSATGDKPAYTAFDNAEDGRATRLHLCPLESAAWEWLPYYDLHRIVHDGPHGTRLGLVWAYAVVVIKGRNLQMLDRHLAQEAAIEVRAFDPARFQAVGDQMQPFIESLEIITESRKTMMEAEMSLIADIEGRH